MTESPLEISKAASQMMAWEHGIWRKVIVLDESIALAIFWTDSQE